jgi:hypothetical protein
MARLVPATHARLLRWSKKGVDARDEHGHDGDGLIELESA